MTIIEIHNICKEEKQKATNRMNSKTGFGKQDAATAVNAWDELLGQLYKPNKISKKQFNKTKTVALRIAAMIGSPPYRNSVEKKIKQLNLN